MKQADQAEDEALKSLEQMLDGYEATQYVALAAQLGIADLLAAGPLSAEPKFASRTECPNDNDSTSD
jgi:hypothetical protein